jgi:hypothetical protein
MTAIPHLKPMPGVSPLPPECRGSGYSFAAAGRDCCHCAEYGDLRDVWLEHPASLIAFHELVEHIHTCPACRAVAASLPVLSAVKDHASVPRAWLGTEGEMR